MSWFEQLVVRKRFIAIAAVAVLAALLLAPSGAAHPTATALSNPATGARCYTLNQDAGISSYWIETNGLGPDSPYGVPFDTPIVHTVPTSATLLNGGYANSGLQVEPVTVGGTPYPPDMQVPFAQWLLACSV